MSTFSRLSPRRRNSNQLPNLGSMNASTWRHRPAGPKVVKPVQPRRKPIPSWLSCSESLLTQIDSSETEGFAGNPRRPSKVPPQVASWSSQIPDESPWTGNFSRPLAGALHAPPTNTQWVSLPPNELPAPWRISPPFEMDLDEFPPSQYPSEVSYSPGKKDSDTMDIDDDSDVVMSDYESEEGSSPYESQKPGRPASSSDSIAPIYRILGPTSSEASPNLSSPRSPKSQMIRSRFGPSNTLTDNLVDLPTRDKRKEYRDEPRRFGCLNDSEDD
jgi:hypothetical protein